MEPRRTGPRPIIPINLTRLIRFWHCTEPGGRRQSNRCGNARSADRSTVRPQSGRKLWSSLAGQEGGTGRCRRTATPIQPRGGGPQRRLFGCPRLPVGYRSGIWRGLRPGQCRPGLRGSRAWSEGVPPEGRRATPGGGPWRYLDVVTDSDRSQGHGGQGECRFQGWRSDLPGSCRRLPCMTGGRRRPHSPPTDYVSSGMHSPQIYAAALATRPTTAL
jgi:hypothetical protein